MTQIICRKQVRINLEKRAQYRFRDDFGAHRAMQKEIQIVFRPTWDLLLRDFLVVINVVRRGRVRKSTAEDSGSYNEQSRNAPKPHCHRFIETRPKFQRESNPLSLLA